MTTQDIGFDTPLTSPNQRVIEDWIDYNGHLNLAFYHVIFDRSVDHFFDLLGVGEAYARSGVGSCFALEAHVHYLQELSLGDEVSVRLQLLDFDAKRIHFMQQMYHLEQGYLAATSEQLTLHVDMASRRAAAFPEEVLQKLTAILAEHAKLEVPEQVGHVIGIKRRL